MTNDQIKWTDAEREAADPWEVFADTDGHNSIRGKGADAILDALAKHIAAREAQAWEEGFEAGHQSARAVNPEFPRQPRNPYRSEP